eukprot:CAMPEP_0174365440 /NCGR_PEP_ID=MMETSP0811_2-20130205/77274_1 /TAXON_ID=73025 ORGANISM="Eutreptiella gymnastica-like, Strain CCMP1594" /NCGR_SAMPLE_ID=MMETSP0811_2 /ASSEMBLY_ACC=CAM_ASM_000667 /LENGTH=104 /DNA_ID=CAMNT_0015506089 /DNA_START=716 /DNA_END=1027 /DNA_ORIENTATION=+
MGGLCPKVVGFALPATCVAQLMDAACPSGPRVPNEHSGLNANLLLRHPHNVRMASKRFLLRAEDMELKAWVQGPHVCQSTLHELRGTGHEHALQLVLVGHRLDL